MKKLAKKLSRTNAHERGKTMDDWKEAALNGKMMNATNKLMDLHSDLTARDAKSVISSYLQGFRDGRAAPNLAMSDELRLKANRLMYRFTKDAARQSFAEYLEDSEVTDEEWDAIKAEFKDKLGIDNTYL